MAVKALKLGANSIGTRRAVILVCSQKTLAMAAVIVPVLYPLINL
jgi:hypothetical protein